jgi:hypothetical protein
MYYLYTNYRKVSILQIFISPIKTTTRINYKQRRLKKRKKKEKKKKKKRKKKKINKKKETPPYED